VVIEDPDGDCDDAEGKGGTGTITWARSSSGVAAVLLANWGCWKLPEHTKI
jgi:hypothetical protein